MRTAAYRILSIKGTETILCLLCDRYSAHPQDIALKYCGWCHVWLDDVPWQYDPILLITTNPREYRATGEAP